MIKLHKQQLFQCSLCKAIYSEYDHAKMCCAPSPIILNGYICPQCERFHDTELLAKSCCLPKSLLDWGFSDVIFHEGKGKSV